MIDGGLLALARLILALAMSAGHVSAIPPAELAPEAAGAIVAIQWQQPAPGLPCWLVITLPFELNTGC